MSAATRDLQHALERVYAGDQAVEALCVMDALDDLGWRLVPAPAIRGQVEAFPVASSTRGLPKKRSGG